MTPQNRSKIRSLFKMEPKIAATVILFVLVAVISVVFLVYDAGTKKELRASLTSESIVYLESDDIGLVIKTLDENAGGGFRKDLSALSGMRIGIAISGFAAREEGIDKSASVLNLTPQFGAVIDTGLWSWQLKNLLEGPVNSFIRKQMGGDVEQKVEGIWTVWENTDGRKLYLLIDGARIFFGNDKTTVASCLAADRGEKPSMMEDVELDKYLSDNSGQAIFGYFPKRAIEKFADLAGISAAVSNAEEGGARLLISRLVPQLLRNSVESVIWSARVNKSIFEDRIEIMTTAEVSRVFAATLKSGKADSDKLTAQIPVNSESVTYYKVQKPQLAFRSLILVAANNTDSLSGKLITSFSSSLLQPYGIADPETFLNNIGSNLITYKSAGDSGGAVVSYRDRAKAISALSNGFRRPTEKELDSSELVMENQEAGLTAKFLGDILILGSIEKPDQKENDAPITRSAEYQKMINTNAVAATTAIDMSDYGYLSSTRSGKKIKGRSKYYLLETDFEGNRIVRTYHSSFGLIGGIFAGILE